MPSPHFTGSCEWSLTCILLWPCACCFSWNYFLRNVSIWPHTYCLNKDRHLWWEENEITISWNYYMHRTFYYDCMNFSRFWRLHEVNYYILTALNVTQVSVWFTCCKSVMKCCKQWEIRFAKVGISRKLQHFIKTESLEYIEYHTYMQYMYTVAFMLFALFLHHPNLLLMCETFILLTLLI